MNDNNDATNKSRRDFLVSTAGIAATGFTGFAWAAQPCPPPSVSVAGGTSSNTSCVASTPGQLPILTLISAASSGPRSWTFGQAFRQGDVPSGHFITSNATSTQADVRNRWPDGSVKYAVLSGLASFSQNSPKAIQLATTTSAPGTGNVAEPTSLDVAVTLSGAVAGTYTLQSCLGVDRSAWNRSAAGRVRQILGPVMSEFHYYCPTSDSQVAVWFYVRRYASGETEVETVIENGWIMVAAPGARSYTVGVRVSGSSTFSATLNHLHHTRWSRVDWVGTSPQITPKHDPAYLRASKLVPNYAFNTPTSTAFAGLATTINSAPFALGNWTEPMGNAGDQAAIAVLPHWESLYCMTADSRAYAATVGNVRGLGRWPVHFRDENTGRPPVYHSYPTMTMTSGWGSIQPPAASGGEAGTGWDIPHHPSIAYLAYIIEGRWTQVEEMQFAASYNMLDANPATRNIAGIGDGIISCVNAPYTTRGAAWAWRTMGQAAALSPKYLGSGLSAADLAVGDSFRTSIQNTMIWNKEHFIDGTIDAGRYKNTIGWLGQYDRYSDHGPTSEWWGSGWMENFQAMALAHISDLGIEGITQSNLVAVRNFKYSGIVRLIGTDATWNFREACTYDMPYLKNGSDPGTPVYMTTAESWVQYKLGASLPAISSNRGDTLKDHTTNTDMAGGSSSDDATGYWAPVIANLSTAIEHGVSGASTAYSLVTAASNYNPVAHGINDSPRWGIRGR